MKDKELDVKVLLENIDGKINILVEGHKMLADEVKGVKLKLNTVFEQVSENTLMIYKNTKAIEENTKDIKEMKEDIVELKEDVKELKEDSKEIKKDIKSIDRKLDTKADVSRVISLEKKVEKALAK